VRWVVFDYGEVICHRTEALPDIAASLGVAAEEFAAAYWAARDAYDRGLTDLEYWQAIGTAVGVEIGADRAAELTKADLAGWLDTDPAMLALIAELDAAGQPLALLSNAPATHGRAFERQDWARHFRHIVISGDHGCAKPDPAIWRILTGALGAEPGDCFFVDDRQVNIDGARAAGLRAERFTGADAVREQLTALGVL
jgi:putative hydrolase of the HAD superfamily